MMRKWLILATVLLLFGSGMWLAFGERGGKTYPTDAVSAEVKRICTGMGLDFSSQFARSETASSKYRQFQWVRRWLGIRHQMKSKIWIFTEPPSDFLNPSCGLLVQVRYDGNQVLHVRIEPDVWPSKKAESLKKELRSKFPGLDCQVKKP